MLQFMARKTALDTAVGYLDQARRTLEVQKHFYDTANANCGAEFRKARELTGKSCRQMARELGITPAYLSDIERGRRGFPKRLAGVFR